MNQKLIAVIFCTALAACEKPDQKAATAATVTAPPQPPISAAEWRAAVASTMVKTDLKEDDGMQEYFACFGTHLPGKRPNCSEAVFKGRLDAFNRSQRYQTADSGWRHDLLRYASKPVAQIAPVVAMLECDKEPSVLLKVSYASDSWAFIKSAAVLADGVVVLERELDHQSVKRDNDHRGVTENANVLLSKAQWAALRKAGDAPQLLVRVNGDKGYVMMDAKHIASLRTDIQATASAYDKIAAVLAPLQQRECTKAG